MFRLAAVAVLAVPAVAPAADAPDYLKDVKPVLAERCYACHGALQQKAGLRVDTAAAMREAGAVVPGKPDDSPLLLHVLGKDGYDRMPPPAEGEPLTAKQADALRRWIAAGATAPAGEQADPDPREHWAFRAPVRPPVPTIRNPRSAIRNPVDSFLEAERQRHGLTARAEADKRLLLRRLTLDLTGLPPTPEETAAFLADSSPDAYEKVVERLLASPRYGERWGRHFLDVWRYSDWWGLGAEVRNSQKHMWHWRDWVVESLNADLGYDQLVRRQLAADELFPADPAQLRATGYLARSYFKFNRTTWLDEVVEHAAKGFLGLTANCAKCHDHKYDPVSQTDYYRLRAFFEPYQVRTDLVPGVADVEANGVPRAFDCNADAPTYKHTRGDERQPQTDRVIRPGVPGLLAFADLTITPVPLPAEAHSPHLRPEVVETYRSAAAKDGPLAVAAVEARARADRLKATGPAAEFKTAAAAAAKAEKAVALAKAEAALAAAEAELAKAADDKKPAAAKKRDAAKTALDAAKKAADNPGEAYTPLRGSVKTAESNVEPEANRQKPFPTTSTGRRTALANWIADRRNPLTARVLVNHVWARHFGKPLVATVFDFGRKGARPTHPELLDWLAVEFVEHGWSLKHLHRLMVTSAAYRMSSSAAGADADRAKDGDNRYYWRQNPTRMEAQAVRDSLLHLAGTLDLTVGGPSVPLGQQEGSTRRSLYFFQSHNDHNKFLMQFDDANVLDCYRRTESIVPQQALTLSNSKLAITTADAIAARVAKLAADDTDAGFVTAAFRAVLAADPSAAELTACRDAMAEWRTLAAGRKHPDPAARARAGLVAALLNHNDFVTVR